jgi:hypothetical protein
MRIVLGGVCCAVTVLVRVAVVVTVWTCPSPKVIVENTVVAETCVTIAVDVTVRTDCCTVAVDTKYPPKRPIMRATAIPTAVTALAMGVFLF